MSFGDRPRTSFGLGVLGRAGVAQSGGEMRRSATLQWEIGQVRNRLPSNSPERGLWCQKPVAREMHGTDRLIKKRGLLINKRGRYANHVPANCSLLNKLHPAPMGQTTPRASAPSAPIGGEASCPQSRRCDVHRSALSIECNADFPIRNASHRMRPMPSEMAERRESSTDSTSVTVTGQHPRVGCGPRPMAIPDGLPQGGRRVWKTKIMNAAWRPRGHPREGKRRKITPEDCRMIGQRRFQELQGRRGR
jgi:hypothetical protein